MISAIYPGTFDPITVGHLDVIKRAAGVYDKLYVAIMDNKAKSCTFNKQERRQLIEKCVDGLDNVQVVVDDGLTVELAERLGCRHIIRGIRAVSDYESELALATANMSLNPRVETILMVAKPELSFLSSSMAKELASFHADISAYIPEVILDDVAAKLYK